jgi:hypothetical protein
MLIKLIRPEETRKKNKPITQTKAPARELIIDIEYKQQTNTKINTKTLIVRLKYENRAVNNVTPIILEYIPVFPAKPPALNITSPFSSHIFWLVSTSEYPVKNIKMDIIMFIKHPYINNKTNLLKSSDLMIYLVEKYKIGDKIPIKRYSFFNSPETLIVVTNKIKINKNRKNSSALKWIFFLTKNITNSIGIHNKSYNPNSISPAGKIKKGDKKASNISNTIYQCLSFPPPPIAVTNLTF